MLGRPHLLSLLQRRILAIMLADRRPMSDADVASAIGDIKARPRIGRTMATMVQFGYLCSTGRSTAHPCELTKAGLDLAANLDQAERAPTRGR
jgi:hypothetical protein